MSFMDRTKHQLGEMSSKGEPITRVINGRLYYDTGKDGIYHAVSRGMDDACDLKVHHVPEYVINNNKEYEIVDGREYMDSLRKEGAKTVSAKKVDGVPQDFVQLDKDVAVMCPCGENGRMRPQTVDAGGYLTITAADSCYGIAADEFNSNYVVLKDKTVSPNREIPEVEGMTDHSLEDKMEGMQA